MQLERVEHNLFEWEYSIANMDEFAPKRMNECAKFEMICWMKEHNSFSKAKTGIADYDYEPICIKRFKTHQKHGKFLNSFSASEPVRVASHYLVTHMGTRKRTDEGTANDENTCPSW